MPKELNFATASTGHADSPESIVIRKKVGTKTPPVVYKKGRKTAVAAVPTKKSEKAKENFEGLAQMLKTPAAKKSPKRAAEAGGSPALKRKATTPLAKKSFKRVHTPGKDAAAPPSKTRS